MFVGIGHVARGRHDKYRLGPCGAGTRANHEGYVFLVLARDDMRRVEAAFETLGNRQREVDIPTGVVNVVVMKMNRAILIRRIAPVHFGAGPIVTLHGPRRHVDGPAVKAIGRNVLDHLGAHLAREVPRADDFRHQAFRRGAPHEARHIHPAKRLVGEAWAVDLAVVMSLDDAPAAGGPLVARRHDKRGAVAANRAHL